ncbi:hypothetical protein [Wolbachia endosymbiont of Cylisticus convexus]|uniref:hypothetical protein n=1 Tax=Wolbachia endosymbiont of Cylisticus convexus TaxID=118728 RepID=UPI001F1C602E|nr:hypothetical protein [Wolbachia endosymbiont of Cylisticus convexus]
MKIFLLITAILYSIVFCSVSAKSIPKNSKMLFWQAEVGKGANVFNRKIVCTSFANGKRHDFRIFKESMLSSFS